MKKLFGFHSQRKNHQHNGDKPLVIQLVRGAYNIDLNKVDTSFTKLHRACFLNYNITKIRKYLRQGLNPNILDNVTRSSPFHLAIVNGNLEIIKILLENGADSDRLDGDGKTPLIKAIECSHEEIIQFLLFHGVDANIQDKHYGNTALHWAISLNYYNGIKLILRYSQKLEINIRNYNRENVLHLLAKSTDTLDILKDLLDKGADINAKDIHSRTPLMIAILFANTEAVRILLNKGASYNIRDEENHTCFDIAKSIGNQEIISLLKQIIDDNNIFKSSVSYTKPDKITLDSWTSSNDDDIQHQNSHLHQYHDNHINNTNHYQYQHMHEDHLQFYNNNIINDNKEDDKNSSDYQDNHSDENINEDSDAERNKKRKEKIFLNITNKDNHLFQPVVEQLKLLHANEIIEDDDNLGKSNTTVIENYPNTNDNREKNNKEKNSDHFIQEIREILDEEIRENDELDAMLFNTEKNRLSKFNKDSSLANHNLNTFNKIDISDLSFNTEQRKNSAKASIRNISLENQNHLFADLWESEEERNVDLFPKKDKHKSISSSAKLFLINSDDDDDDNGDDDHGNNHGNDRNKNNKTKLENLLEVKKQISNGKNVKHSLMPISKTSNMLHIKNDNLNNSQHSNNKNKNNNNNNNNKINNNNKNTNDNKTLDLLHIENKGNKNKRSDNNKNNNNDDNNDDVDDVDDDEDEDEDHDHNHDDGDDEYNNINERIGKTSDLDDIVDENKDDNNNYNDNYVNSERTCVLQNESERNTSGIIKLNEFINYNNGNSNSNYNQIDTKYIQTDTDDEDKINKLKLNELEKKLWEGEIQMKVLKNQLDTENKISLEKIALLNKIIEESKESMKADRITLQELLKEKDVLLKQNQLLMKENENLVKDLNKTKHDKSYDEIYKRFHKLNDDNEQLRQQLNYEKSKVKDEIETREKERINFIMENDWLKKNMDQLKSQMNLIDIIREKINEEKQDKKELLLNIQSIGKYMHIFQEKMANSEEKKYEQMKLWIDSLVEKIADNNTASLLQEMRAIIENLNMEIKHFKIIIKDIYQYNNVNTNDIITNDEKLMEKVDSNNNNNNQIKKYNDSYIDKKMIVFETKMDKIYDYLKKLEDYWEKNQLNTLIQQSRSASSLWSNYDYHSQNNSNFTTTNIQHHSRSVFVQSLISLNDNHHTSYKWSSFYTIKKELDKDIGELRKELGLRSNNVDKLIVKDLKIL